MTVKRAMSNIAWAPAHRREVYQLMASYGFTGLEIAPGLLFPDAQNAFEPSHNVIDCVLGELDEFGLQLVSMQSLLFGCEGAELFGAAEEQMKFTAQMRRAIALAGRLGIGNIVFGSPKNRLVPQGMAYKDAIAHAKDVFNTLGDFAETRGVRIAIEPNPVEYGANFLTTIEEAAAFVRTANHPSVTLNFDIGAITIAHQIDHLESYFSQYKDIVSHIHLSEPQLVPAPSNAAISKRAHRLAEDNNFEHWVSIEMRSPQAPADELAVIEQCLKLFSTAEDNVR